MRYSEPLRQKLLRRAETVLRPSVAILLECALESERSPAAAEHLARLTAHYYRCAETGEPLSDDNYETFVMYSARGASERETFAVGLLSEETLERETAFQSPLSPGDDGLAELIVGQTLSLDISPLAPMVLGVGIADTAEEAGTLARLALFRSPDIHSPDGRTAESERRILARINHRGPGAGGLGGGHTALAVSIEYAAPGYITLLPGSCFTRLASMTVS